MCNYKNGIATWIHDKVCKKDFSKNASKIFGNIKVTIETYNYDSFDVYISLGYTTYILSSINILDSVYDIESYLAFYI